MDLDDLERLSPDDHHYENAIRQYLEGTYQSNWYFLVCAIRSNLIHAAINTQKLINVYERAKSRNQRQAETWFIINFDYSLFLSGPLLGTILFTGAALEAFLRMCMRAFWEQNTSQQRRGKGTSNDLLIKLADFDKKEAFKKLDHAYKTLLKKEVPTEYSVSFKELMAFRNNCFHSDPILIKSGLFRQKTRGGHIADVTSSNHYPYLWESNRPLSITHSLRAVRLHDAIVSDLFVRRSPRLKMHSDLHDENPVGNLIETGLPKNISPKDLDLLADVWDNTVDKQLQEVTSEEINEFGNDLKRKATLHSVR
jgi:hypothetical protein